MPVPPRRSDWWLPSVPLIDPNQVSTIWFFPIPDMIWCYCETLRLTVCEDYQFWMDLKRFVSWQHDKKFACEAPWEDPVGSLVYLRKRLRDVRYEVGGSEKAHGLNELFVHHIDKVRAQWHTSVCNVETTGPDYRLLQVGRIRLLDLYPTRGTVPYTTLPETWVGAKGININWLTYLNAVTSINNRGQIRVKRKVVWEFNPSKTSTEQIIKTGSRWCGIMLDRATMKIIGAHHNSQMKMHQGALY